MLLGTLKHLITTPQNAAVKSGIEFMFKCRTNSNENMAWRFIAPATNSRHLISNGQDVHEDFNGRLDKNTEHFNLKIKQARRTDGGTYVCEDADASATAYLIAIGKNLFLPAPSIDLLHFRSKRTPV